ncbi:MAG: hypothetical protein ABT20_06150 [Rubrivivax sp. SCN 70-15]|nr:MAG: hypothetical protein ABT20_06150 [Rubrivivax sp. SCN 70-15]
MQSLIEFLSRHHSLAVAAVFAASLLEAVAVIGSVVPGSSVVFAAGMLVGLQALAPWPVALAAVSGAILGDGFSYWLGRHYHDRLRALWPLKAYPALFERGQAYFSRNGGKSVFLGRFLGPVRAVVPVVAGMSDMPVLGFTLVNMLSALAWAAAHLLPGALFGASLQLAGAVSSRLAVLLAGAAAIVWLCAAAMRGVYRRSGPVLRRARESALAWARARRSGVLARVTSSLLDPERPESPGLLIAAALLLGGAWAFLGILEDVVSNDPLVRWDHVVFSTLQGLRTPWGDAVMIAATELGSAAVVIPVVAAVAGVLAYRRCWRALAYVVTAIGFAQVLVWALKATLGRARPTAMYSGAEQFSFPSGHAASSVVAYGLLAFLLARQKSPRVQLVITFAATMLIGLISFSRLYLGAHWLSDVLASLTLGTAWVALLSIVYLVHAGGERLPARALSLTAAGALVLAGVAVASAQRATDVARYAPPAAAAPALLADWQGGGWQQLPVRRTEMDGDAEEPMSVQWAGTAQRIEGVLQAAGWRQPPPWTLRSALLWLLPSTPLEQLPVLAKFHQGEPATLTLEALLDPTRRAVIRLWPTAYQVGAADAAPAPLWIGMVTVERLRHPAGLATLALTEPGPALQASGLASTLRRSGVALEIRQRGGGPVLLAH